MTANAATSSLFGVGLVPFLTEGWDGKAEGHSWELTAAELLGRVANYGVYGPSAKKATGSSEGSGYIPVAIKKNLREEAPAAIGGVVTAMIVNGGLKKFGVYKRLNRMVRQVGLGKAVKF
ncbi:MAG: hypothetical protein QF535_05280 [Anaerolineales bacterium]|nr:hypothetical protein [Anaerolineales bacterium]